MSYRHSLYVVATAALFIGTSALSQVQARVRGTITAIDGGSLTIKEWNGRSLPVGTDSTTTYADVVTSSLDAIKVNDYVGTAVKGSLNRWIAVEIVLVPESMRPGRIGFYPWDRLPDTSGVPSQSGAESYAASGVVSSTSLTEPELTDTSMTNGTIAAAESSPIGRTLTVTLVGGVSTQIAVSRTAPVVRFVPSNRLTISEGSAVVVWTRPDGRARLVAVGKGITPPM
jgi:hypothetical protein